MSIKCFRDGGLNLPFNGVPYSVLPFFTRALLDRSFRSVWVCLVTIASHEKTTNRSMASSHWFEASVNG